MTAWLVVYIVLSIITCICSIFLYTQRDLPKNKWWEIPLYSVISPLIAVLLLCGLVSVIWEEKLSPLYNRFKGYKNRKILIADAQKVLYDLQKKEILCQKKKNQID